MRLRKNPTQAIDGTAGEAGAGMRHGRGRGWGPFSGGQLTAIILGIVVAIAFPVGAWAVSGTTVFVTDNVSGKTAAVNSSRQLAVNGSVIATEASPKNFYVNNAVVGATSSPIATPPAGKALVVTSIVLNTFKNTTPGSGEFVAFSVSANDATCSTTTSLLLDVNPRGIGETVMPFQPGIVVPANRSLCAKNGDPTNLSPEEFVYGYLIPAANAPTGE